MEKRVFSLTGASELRWNIANGVIFMAFAILGFCVSHEQGSHYIFLSVILLMPLLYWYGYVSRRSTRLEVSDDGLFVMSRRNLGYRLRWDAITCCKVWAAPRWRDRPFEQIVLTGSNRRVIVIPGSCPDGAEILEILKQRLPENLFEAK